MTVCQCLKVRKRRVERMVRRAGTCREFKVVRQAPDRCKRSADKIVISHHRCDRIGDTPEECIGFRRTCGSCCFQGDNVRKKNSFFLVHVWRHLFKNLPDELLNLDELGMVCAMTAVYLVCQHRESFQFRAGWCMTFTHDVINQLRQRARDPRLYWLRGMTLSFGELLEKLWKGDILLRADLLQRFSAATAVVDSESFKYPHR